MWVVFLIMNISLSYFTLQNLKIYIHTLILSSMKTIIKSKLLFIFSLGIILLFNSCNNNIEEYWSNGNLKTSIEYLNSDKTDYNYCEYYDNGQLKTEASYRNEFLDGDYRKYFKNGKLQLFRRYKMGKIDGLETIYDEKGEDQSQSIYKNSLLKEKELFTDKKSVKNINNLNLTK